MQTNGVEYMPQIYTHAFQPCICDKDIKSMNWKEDSGICVFDMQVEGERLETGEL